MAAWVAPHTRAVRLMVPWWRRIRGQYGRWYFSGAAYAGNTVDGGLGSIEKYWEELGSIGRKYCRLYCKQYGVILLTGLKRQRRLPKFPKASQNLPKSPTPQRTIPRRAGGSPPRRNAQFSAAKAAAPPAATHNSAPRKRQNPPRRHAQLCAAQAAEPCAATHNSAPRKRQNSTPQRTI